MKKLIVAAFAAGAAYAVWLKVASERQNQVVWVDVTDEVPSN